MSPRFEKDLQLLNRLRLLLRVTLSKLKQLQKMTVTVMGEEKKNPFDTIELLLKGFIFVSLSLSFDESQKLFRLSGKSSFFAVL